MIEEIKKYDTNFDESIFLSKADHIFIMLLDAIRDRDLSNVKHYLSNDIYERYNSLVNMYISDKKIRLFDEMNVKSTEIKNVSITEDSINIEVLLTSRYMDYFVNEEGNYLYGTNDHRVEKENHLVFTKKKVAKELGTEASGVPFIVVGEKYFSGFSSTSSPEQIKKAIKDAYENEDYQDVVAAVKKGISIKKDDNTSILPIIVVSAIAIVVVLALVFFTKEK